MRPDRSAARGGLVRGVVVGLAGMAAAAGVAAVELNRLPDEERPSLAARLWPDHPAQRQDQAMREIGLAAARGGSVPDSAIRTMHWLAQAEPLRIEPYLVEATVAAMAGDAARAETLYANAAARDPRSVLAHYALADRYLRIGRLADGLAQVSILDRLVPSATQSLATALAAYAAQPGTTAVLRQFFVRSPAMAPQVLAELAKNPAQVDRALVLGADLPPGGDRRWQQTLVQTLVDHHDYARAAAAWRRLTGTAPYRGLFNPRFAASDAAPPFNWSPFDSNGALAEPDPGGGLKVVYYGRDNVVVTRQLLVLPPGRYTLATDVERGAASSAASPGSSDSGGGLGWQVSCAEGSAVIGTLPLRGGVSGRTSMGFTVPSGCGAAWLELRGTAGEFGEPVALTVRHLSLTPGAPS